MTIEEAIADPRGSHRNNSTVSAEQEFIDRYGDALEPYHHPLVPPGAPGTSASEIGAATAIEFGPAGRMTAESEPARRGGGSALVLFPLP
jgi:gamma-glutamyltranspeptidase/glutathione hydrolase